MKRRLFLSLCVFFLFALPLAAQDEETDTETDAGTAPEIVSLTPNAVTITGGGSATVDVEFADEDGDAVRFIWEVFEAGEDTSWNLPDGFFNQSIVGTTIPVTFRCDNVDAMVSIELIVEDAQGNRSESAFFDLQCQSSFADLGQGGGATAGTAPEVVSVTPSRIVIVGEGTATTEIEYTDEDGDASRFLWSIVEASDETGWTLVDGFFSQSVVGTTIPVTFRCDAVDGTRTLEMQLIVEDEAGNQSDPVTLTLICVTEG